MKLGTDVELSLPVTAWQDYVQVRKFEERMSMLGTKSAPTVIDGVQLHPDSLACEFALVDPCSTVGEFMMRFQHAREIAQSYMGTHLQGYNFIDTSSLPLFSVDICPTVFEAANTFGCSPDWIILRSGKLKLRDTVPDFVRSSTVKETGFHLHIDLPQEYCKDERLLCEAITNYYERTRMLHTWGHPTARPWYRKPMTFRPKKYGFEYRSFGASLADNQPALEMAVTQAFQLMDEIDRRCA